MNPTPLISELQVGESFAGALIIKNSMLGIATNKSQYLRVTLADKSGELTSMIWDVANNDHAVSTFKSGHVVHVNGIITDYQGVKQINMQSYYIIDDLSQLDMTRLVKSAPIDINASFLNIVTVAKNIQTLALQRITLKLLEDYQADYKTMPAAKSVHHAYRGGLLHHTEGMLRQAQMMTELYPVLDKDLLYAGVILHDLGKVIEYTGDIATDKTLTGQLKGHISIGSELIADTAKKLNIDQLPDDQQESVLLLQHMVLSHHGLAKNGWGSTVSPLIIEAEVLHRIDMMDAHINAYMAESEDVAAGEFTPRIFGLDNRSFYKHQQ